MRKMMVFILIAISARAQERLFDVYMPTDTLRNIIVEKFDLKEGFLYFRKDGESSMISTTIINMIKDSQLGTIMWINPHPIQIQKAEQQTLQDANLQASIDLKNSAKRYLDLVFILIVLSGLLAFIAATP